MQAIRTILFPTDFSEPSQAAMELACSLCRAYGAGLTMLHVVQPQMATLGGTQALPPPPDVERQREASEKLKGIQHAIGAIRAERLVREGGAAAAILQVAQETHCGLIVMGTHGRSGLGRLLMGSVADAVVRNATCPVLTVKASAAKGEYESAPRRESAMA
jgi:nucleotide-binding universal stress UspA family protein